MHRAACALLTQSIALTHIFHLVLFAAGLNNNNFAQTATMDSQWRVKPKGCCGGADKEHEELVRAPCRCRPCATPAFQRDDFTQVLFVCSV